MTIAMIFFPVGALQQFFHSARKIHKAFHLQNTLSSVTNLLISSVATKKKKWLDLNIAIMSLKTRLPMMQ
jgi:hypothetical protein